MKAKHLMVIFCSFALFASIASGCAQSTAPDEEGPYSVVRQALVDELLQCRESISDCVTSAAGMSDVLECRSEFEACVTTVTDAANTAVDDLASCQDAAVECATDASSVSEVLACREELTACTDGLLDEAAQLPDLLGLPDLGDLPNAEAVISCSTDLTDCVSGGGSVVECADQARECLGAELPVDLPAIELPDLPDIPDAGAVLECSQSLSDCVSGGGGVVECADQARECLGVELPVDLPVELPDMTLPDVGAGAECMTSLADCVAGGGSIMDCADEARACAQAALPAVQLPGIPDLGLPTPGDLLGGDLPLVGELPDPVGVANGGIDCVQGLADCITGGESVITCADAARTCLMDQLTL